MREGVCTVADDWSLELWQISSKFCSSIYRDAATETPPPHTHHQWEPSMTKKLYNKLFKLNYNKNIQVYVYINIIINLTIIIL